MRNYMKEAINFTRSSNKEEKKRVAESFVKRGDTAQRNLQGRSIGFKKVDSSMLFKS